MILADEPTGNLDIDTSMQILQLLDEINKTGTTIFMATHNDRIIDTTKKRVIVLEGGRLKEDRRKKGEDKKHVEHEEKKIVREEKQEKLEKKEDRVS